MAWRKSFGSKLFSCAHFFILLITIMPFLLIGGAWLRLLSGSISVVDWVPSLLEMSGLDPDFVKFEADDVILSYANRRLLLRVLNGRVALGDGETVHIDSGDLYVDVLGSLAAGQLNLLLHLETLDLPVNFLSQKGGVAKTFTFLQESRLISTPQSTLMTKDLRSLPAGSGSGAAPLSGLSANGGEADLPATDPDPGLDSVRRGFAFDMASVQSLRELVDQFPILDSLSGIEIDELRLNMRPDYQEGSILNGPLSFRHRTDNNRERLELRFLPRLYGSVSEQQVASLNIHYVESQEDLSLRFQLTGAWEPLNVLIVRSIEDESVRSIVSDVFAALPSHNMGADLFIARDLSQAWQLAATVKGDRLGDFRLTCGGREDDCSLAGRRVDPGLWQRVLQTRFSELSDARLEGEANVAAHWNYAESLVEPTAQSSIGGSNPTRPDAPFLTIKNYIKGIFAVPPDAHMTVSVASGTVWKAEFMEQPIPFEDLRARVSVQGLKTEPSRRVRGYRFELLEASARLVGRDGIGYASAQGHANLSEAGTIHAMEWHGQVETLPWEEIHIWWPKGLAPGVRGWLIDHVKVRVISKAGVDLVFKREEREDRTSGQVRLQSIDGFIDFQNANLTYAEGWPVVESINGRAEFDKNQFVVRGQTGHTGRISVRQAEITFDDLANANADVQGKVDLDLVGPAEEVLGLLEREPIEVNHRLSFDVDRFRGWVKGNLLLEFISEKDLQLSDITASASGTVSDGRLLESPQTEDIINLLALLSEEDVKAISGPAGLSDRPNRIVDAIPVASEDPDSSTDPSLEAPSQPRAQVFQEPAAEIREPPALGATPAKAAPKAMFSLRDGLFVYQGPMFTGTELADLRLRADFNEDHIQSTLKLKVGVGGLSSHLSSVTASRFDGLADIEIISTSLKGIVTQGFILDLEDVDFTIPLFEYHKPLGQEAAARVTFDPTRESEGTKGTNRTVQPISFQFDSVGGALVNGELVLDGETSELLTFNIPEFHVGKTNGYINKQLGGFDGQISQLFLPEQPAQSILNFVKENRFPDVPLESQDADRLGTLKIDSLSAGGRAILENIVLETGYSAVGIHFANLRAAFTTDPNRERLQPLLEDPARADFVPPEHNSISAQATTLPDRSVVANFETDNLGLLLSSLGFGDRLLAGRLDAVVERKGRGQPFIGKAHVERFLFRDLPTAIRISSILSPLGLGNAIGAEDLLFSEAEATFRYTYPRVVIEKFFASAPGIGWIASGNIGVISGELNIYGSVIPARAINRGIELVPFFGKLFVGHEERGGTFAIDFEAKGSLAEPRINVNPLSVILPGFMRRLLHVFTRPDTLAAPRPTGNGAGDERLDVQPPSEPG